LIHELADGYRTAVQPNDDPFTSRIYLRHRPNLVVLFHCIHLIDANLIDPEIPWVAVKLEELEQVRQNLDLVPFDREIV